MEDKDLKEELLKLNFKLDYIFTVITSMPGMDPYFRLYYDKMINHDKK